MLSLPNITLLSIDCARPFSALVALRETLLWVQPRETLLLTDVRRHPGIAKQAARHGVRVIQHTQTDRIHNFPGITRNFFIDYELALIREPANYIGESSHVLFMEWDSGVLNPWAWQKSWLRYDYIGAPWPNHHDPGWPPCTPDNAVGNSGFSLRSAKFCSLIAEAERTHQQDLSRYSSDRWMCRTMRPWLESRGIKFAPPATAAAFSCENRIYAGEFGFHGRATATMNGWLGWYEELHLADMRRGAETTTAPVPPEWRSKATAAVEPSPQRQSPSSKLTTGTTPSTALALPSLPDGAATPGQDRLRQWASHPGQKPQ